MNEPDDTLLRAAQAWQRLCNVKYRIVLGYKGNLSQIILTFSNNEFYHLAGLHYLTDIRLPKYNHTKTVQEILNGSINIETLKRSSFYNSKVAPRLETIISLEALLDNDFKLFKFTPSYYPFTTTIKADYLISKQEENKTFVFIIKGKTEEVTKCEYLCCSAFKEDSRDYEQGQRHRTILKKEKIDLQSGSTKVLFLLKEIDTSIFEKTENS